MDAPTLPQYQTEPIALHHLFSSYTPVHHDDDDDDNNFFILPALLSLEVVHSSETTAHTFFRFFLDVVLFSSFLLLMFTLAMTFISDP